VLLHSTLYTLKSAFQNALARSVSPTHTDKEYHGKESLLFRFCDLTLQGGEAWPRYFSDNARRSNSPVRLLVVSSSIPNISQPVPELQMPTRDETSFSRYSVVEYLTEAKHPNRNLRTPTLILVKYPDKGIVGVFIVIIAIYSIALPLPFYKKEIIITHSDICHQE